MIVKIKIMKIKNLCYLLLVMVLFNGCRGDSIEYYEDEVKCVGIIIDGIKEGEHICYYPNEKLNAILNYNKGLKDGRAKWYYNNGNIKLEVNYKSGLKEGESKHYYKNGNVDVEVNFVNDKKRGYYDSYDSLSGIILSRIEYIKAPCFYEEDIDKFLNRVWYYNKGDTTKVTIKSDFYLMAKIEEGKGLGIKIYLSNSTYPNGSYEKIQVYFGDCTKNEEIDTVNIGYNNQDAGYYEYKLKKKDIERGYVSGVIEGVGFAINSTDSNVMDNYLRHMFFKWSIKEGKLINY
jgi:antitoxin component YwqK of YwqJK toxin-antitoxin module